MDIFIDKIYYRKKWCKHLEIVNACVNKKIISNLNPEQIADLLIDYIILSKLSCDEITKYEINYNKACADIGLDCCDIFIFGIINFINTNPNKDKIIDLLKTMNQEIENLKSFIRVNLEKDPSIY
jgi:hypothetical protein